MLSHRFDSSRREREGGNVIAQKLVSKLKREKFVQLYKCKYGIKRIAHETGFCYSCVRKHLLQARVELRKPTQRKVTFEMVKKFQKLYKAGSTVREIGVKFGVSRSTVQRWLHKSGVKTRGRGKPKQIAISANQLTEDKAYILGVVGPGDGFLEYRNDVGLYRIKLDVTDKEFAEHFAECLQKVYGLVLKSKKKTREKGMERRKSILLHYNRNRLAMICAVTTSVSRKITGACL